VEDRPDLIEPLRSSEQWTRAALDVTGAEVDFLARLDLHRTGSPPVGTSVEQNDRTSGHLLPDSIDRTRAAQDAFVDRLGADWARTADPG
jgi:hypothetical protein